MTSVISTRITRAGPPGDRKTRARRLKDRGTSVALSKVPYAYTLLAPSDEPATAVMDHSLPAERACLDADLDGLDVRGRHHPGALVFEFHNYEDTHPRLAVEPGKSVAEYEVDSIGPGAVRGFEIGTWRNVDDHGRPGKYVIELPACYVPVELRVQERRRATVVRLAAAGYGYDPRWWHYLGSRADADVSRDRGYLDARPAEKIAERIMICRNASP